MSADGFDSEALLDRVDGDRELLEELLEDFLEDRAEHMARVHEGVESGDMKVLYDGAHGMRGCVANFCASTAFELATRLQELASAGGGAEAEGLARQLEASVEKLEAGLRAFISGGR